MKSLLKKLNVVSNEGVDSGSSIDKKLNDAASALKLLCRSHEHKPFSGFSNGIGSVSSKKNSSSPSNSIAESQDPQSESVSNSEPNPYMEEDYQLQLALELSAKEDPEALQIEALKKISLASLEDNSAAEMIAYKYWNYNALAYEDKILDGFYDLHGPSMESQIKLMPQLVDLQGTPLSEKLTSEVFLVNRATDGNLIKLEQKAKELAIKLHSKDNLTRDIAVLVSEYMGGTVKDPETMLRAWQSLSYSLKTTLNSLVLPLGSLTIGLARHRALMFKVLADCAGVPCRLVKGRLLTGSDDAAMNFVKDETGREFIVDLMADPGTLIPCEDFGHFSRENDSSFVASSSEIAGNLVKRDYESRSARMDDFAANESREFEYLGVESRKFSRANSSYVHVRSPSWTEGISSPAVRRKKVKDVSEYMIDAAKENPNLAQKLHDVLLESGVVAPPDLFTELFPKISDVCSSDSEKLDSKIAEGGKGENGLVLSPKYDGNPVTAAAVAAAAVVASSVVVAASKSISEGGIELPVAAAATATAAAVVATAAINKQHELNFLMQRGVDQRSGSNSSDRGPNSDGMVSDRSSDGGKSDVLIEDVEEIFWEDILIGERMGLGSYGEVYRGEWHGTDVAVKKFLDQDISGEALLEFRSEVKIIQRLRHPNVVLFMGAVTRPPNLSIITEYIPRGSLYKLMQRFSNQLDERRRIRMALDTARGMNYLHNCSPMIVHRDLKSPNLLVDKNWVVKVCDFGLSRMKFTTFLSSRSTAGTAEWMAPEVLRNEPSDEKCDVYSFGVILWELCTLQQPWGGLNPMQVVGAVGFQDRRLEIPSHIDSAIADIITNCWHRDPKRRPSFGDIIAALKPLLKELTSSMVKNSHAKRVD